MSGDLSALENWAGALLLKLTPERRRAVTRAISIELRCSQAQRIAKQRAPDGAAFAARKQTKELRGKSGRVKREKAAMFSKLRTSKWLKVQSTEYQASAGFFKKVCYVARVHQFGMEDRISRKQGRRINILPGRCWGFQSRIGNGFVM